MSDSKVKTVYQDFIKYTCGKVKPTLLQIMVYLFRSKGFQTVTLYRIAHWFRSRSFNVLAGMMERLIYHYCHCEISTLAEIGPGFKISHSLCIIVAPYTIIGDNCEIHQNTTIGYNLALVQFGGISLKF